MAVKDRSMEALAEVMLMGAADPFPIYNELRELDDGVHYLEELNANFAFRYDDVLRTGKEYETFSSDGFWQSPSSVHDPADPEHRRFVDFSSRILVVKDPPAHTRLRNVIRAAFTPRAIALWRPAVERATDALLDQVQPGKECDLVSDFAFHVPVAIIAEILGVPADDRASFHKWSYSFGSTFEFSTQGDARDRAIRDSLKLIDYLADFAEERRRSPGDDLTSIIVNGHVDGEPLDPQDSLAQLVFLLGAGNETTANLITNGTTMLIEHPDVCRRLAQDPDRIPTAVEEMLRCDPPIHMVARLTARDTRLGDTDIPAGALVIPVFPAANRDPRRFDDPERFDIDRPKNQHLTFNHGVHFCVGAPLARLEGEVIFRRLLARFPKISAGTRPPVRRTDNLGLRGWQSRPVVLDKT